MRPFEKLPLKCDVHYQPNFVPSEEGLTIFNRIMEHGISEFTTLAGVQLDFGKLTFMDRKLLESNSIPAKHHGNCAEWFPELEQVRNRLERELKRRFHTAVCIYYPNGSVGVDYHFDPPSFGDTGVIPSLSVGEERLFCLRDNTTNEVFEKVLGHGSVIVMGQGCQDQYTHALPVDPSYKNPRINITFRTYGFQFEYE